MRPRHLAAAVVALEGSRFSYPVSVTRRSPNLNLENMENTMTNLFTIAFRLSAVIAVVLTSPLFGIRDIT